MSALEVRVVGQVLCKVVPSHFGIHIGLLFALSSGYLWYTVSKSIAPIPSVNSKMATSILRIGALLLGAVHSVTAVPVELNGRGI